MADRDDPFGTKGLPSRAGSLVIVGTGIRTVGQMTTEAVAWIKRADKVLFLVGDPIAEGAIRSLNPAGAQSLADTYVADQDRTDAYGGMVDRILACLRAGDLTCAAFYGHPGVFVSPAHEAIRRARAEGFEARMLPGISAEDCLFADLGVDPGIHGCQSFEATDFVLNRRAPDPTSAVVLWQIGVFGFATHKQGEYALPAMPILIEKLERIYGPAHPMFLYDGAVLPGVQSIIRQIVAANLMTEPLSAAYTLYIPPVRAADPDMDAYNRMIALNAAYKEVEEG
ncbi:unnamed protein product [Phaeothamnion confervicola]